MSILEPVLRVPIDIGRSQGAAAARRELAKGIYADQRPSLLGRVLDWLSRTVSDLLGKLAAHTPGGWVGLLVIIAAVAGVLVLVVRALRDRRPGIADEVPVFSGRARSAAEYRAAADVAAAAGDWDEAVRQRFRAIVRSLEERDVLSPRPGRTADEAAAEGGRAIPGCAPGLRAGARSFDDVAYGSRARDRAADEALRELDRQLAAARPELLEAAV